MSRIDQFLEAAIEEARIGLRAGGIPIGSVLVCDGNIIGRGHNQRVQAGSVIHHAEMNCLENAGRQPASVYARCTIYSTLSPCPMCSVSQKFSAQAERVSSPCWLWSNVHVSRTSIALMSSSPY